MSDGDSPAFIHGLLSAICDDTEGREAILHPENDEPDAQPSDDGQEPGEPAGEASHAEAETGDSEESEDDDIADGVDFDDMTFDDVSDDVAEAASEQTSDPQASPQVNDENQPNCRWGASPPTVKVGTNILRK